jgi:uncharacterized OB-fold protein
MDILEPGEIRPMPRASWLTEPFWNAAAVGNLVIQRCERCTKLFFRPEAACPHCLSQEWDWEIMGGRGAIHSYTVVYRPAIPEMRVPYVVADVRLDEGVHMMTNIIGCEPESVAIGRRVRCRFVRINEIHLPFFQLEESSD